MTSTQFELSKEAAYKLIMHACKHPTRRVNGILIGRVLSTKAVELVDVIPLFHQSTLTPMLEVAMEYIESYASQKNLQILGYYEAKPNNTMVDGITSSIMERLQSACASVCLIQLDAKEMGDEDTFGLKVSTNTGCIIF